MTPNLPEFIDLAPTAYLHIGVGASLAGPVLAMQPLFGNVMKFIIDKKMCLLLQKSFLRPCPINILFNEGSHMMTQANPLKKFPRQS